MRSLFFVSHTGGMRFIKKLTYFYILMFLLARTITVWFGYDLIGELFALKTFSVNGCQLWRYFTYAFLHENFWHILCNLLLFYTLCQFLLAFELSLKKLLVIFFSGVCAGGMAWSLFNINHPGYSLIGASAGTATLLTYFCLLYPEKTMSVFLFFIFPIQIKARWVFLVLLGYDLICCIFYESFGQTTIAHSAHLGGILIGYLAVYLEKYKEQHPKQMHGRPKSSYRVHIESDNVIAHEPFDILKKLQEGGLESLTETERQWLARYRKNK